MPRSVNYTRRRSQLTDRERFRRSRTYRVSRSEAFVDPFPHILGTLPEKMVFAELMQRGINFEYQAYHRTVIKEINFSKEYRPDFLLPAEKIVIEVQGSYWHSKPDAIEADAFKFAVFQSIGYKVLAWWDYEIFERLDDLFAQEPRLAHRYKQGKRIITGKEPERDDSKGIRTMNANRARRNAYKKLIKNKPITKSKRKALSSRGIL